MQKNATSYCKYTYAEFAGIRQKNMLMISKTNMINKNWQSIRTNAISSVV